MHEESDWKGSNLLSKENSPYLLQHQHNPVWWQAWGEDAFAQARLLDRPIFLSIGYATCHWCHVMEHESFENPAIADLLNRSFICIKVDREELPDVDAIYMAALHALGQRGGWPLSMWLTPDLTPFYGGTYFPPQQLVRVVEQLQQAWIRDRSRVVQAGIELARHLSGMQKIPSGELALDQNLLLQNLERKKEMFDARWGGFGDAPKFPPSIQCRVLLRTYQRTGDPEALHMVEKTLEGMARGGMYDHIGGGFSRYSTDVYWRIPHFEKMLYDNALIARAYLEAHQVTGKPWYAQVVHETLAYVQRDMTHADGGFFSAEDADSEGEEGKFYVFDPEDLVPVLEPKAISRMCEAFGISPRGNFEHGKSVLQLRPDLDWSVKSEALVKEALEQLLVARDKRIRPLRDDKILTSWNGLMIDTCAYAYRVLQDRRYLEAAERAARFVQAHLWTGEKLRRSWREGSSRHDGTLEDYAYLIQGLLGLYEASGVETWAEWAKQLQEIQDAEFFVPERSAYALTPAAQPHLIVRTLELTDGAMPNANGVTAQNLQKLAGLFGRPSWRDRAEAVMQAGGKLLERHPEAFGSTLLAVDDWLRGGVELVAAIDPAWPDAAQPMRALQQAFLPGVTLAWVLAGTEGLPCTQGRAAGAGGPRYYLCRQFSCAAPETELERVLDQAQTL